MNLRRLVILSPVLCLLSFPLLLQPGEFSFQGQLSGWLSGDAREPALTQLGFRYIPEWALTGNLDNGLTGDLMVSFDAGTAANFRQGGTGIDEDIDAYRLWARLAGDRFEIRAGLQKINFGSALLFRPLRWFDRIDPRDPLQRTEGVKGLLLRYYFPGNANIWLWGLTGNNDLKGWETLPTSSGSVEIGGRLQVPVPAGEAGLTFHHRRADTTTSTATPVPVNENRFALDCKLDIRIGLWFEATLIRRDTDLPLMGYRHMWVLGADYTFPLGNGLHVLAEYSQSAMTDTFLGSGEKAEFLGVSAGYPAGLLDRVSAIYYWDHANHDHYLWLNWQRSTDNWQFHFTLFFNPENSPAYGTPGREQVFAGTGFRIMAVFNH